MTSKDIYDVVILMFGASGWAVAIVKLFTDLREDRRKERDEARKEREETRREREAQAKVAEQIAPFIKELNEPKYLDLYKQMTRHDKAQPLSPDDRARLMNYPSKLEEIGALLLAGNFSRAKVYDKFGEEILACDAADSLWQSEDFHYWKVFRLLAEDMKRERAVRGVR